MNGKKWRKFNVGLHSIQPNLRAVFTPDKTVEEEPSNRFNLLFVLLGLCLAWAIAALPEFAWGATVDLTAYPVSAYNDRPCIGTRNLGDLGCNAKEFTVGANFSAEPGTPPFCVAGSAFSFLVDINLSKSNADRYDITFYTGQSHNTPSLDSSDDIPGPEQFCSATAFPLSLGGSVSGSPWGNLDGNSNICADYVKEGDSTVRVNRIKVLCVGDTNGNLEVPYTLAYDQNTGNPTCNPTDTTTYPIPNNAKCIDGTSTVSGAVKVYSGAYVDILKQTIPAGDPQKFTFTASGDSGTKVIAGVDSAHVDDSYLGPDDFTANYFYPATIDAAGNTIPNPPDTAPPALVLITDQQRERFLINTGSTDRTLTITESPTLYWEPTASISCSQFTGAPTLAVNNATRTITASGLNATNIAARCTVTNIKRSKITMKKIVAGRINDGDDFQVQAAIASGDTNPLTDDAGASISSPVNLTTGGASSVQTIFWSTPSTGGTNHTLTFSDSATSGSLTDYTTTYACTNGLATSGTTLPSGSGISFNLTPEPGDDITCTFTNAAKPTLTKAFSPGTIGVERPATLTFTLTNPAGAPARTGLSFTDTLPNNLVVAPTSNATSTCGSPTITADAGTSTISTSGLDVAAGASTCTVSVDVTSSLPGSYVNGAAQIAISGPLRNGVSNQTLNVRQVSVSKSYGSTEIYENVSSLLTFTLTNGTGNPAQANLTFTDTLAAGTGLTITGVTALSAGCSATTPTYNATGDPSVTLTGVTMTAGTATCTFTVTVKGNTAGTYANTAASISGATNPINVTSLSSTLTVASLGVAKAFSPGIIDIYEPSDMTFTLSNTGSIDATGVNFTDTLNGFYVRSTTIDEGTCSGVTNSLALTVGETDLDLDLTVPSLPPGESCTIVISVSASSPGTYDNTTSGVVANQTGGIRGAVSNTATLTVNFLPIEIYKVASGASVNPGGTITYTIGYRNPNAATRLKNVVFTDPLPEYTTFLSASCGSLPAAISACNISQPDVGAAGAVTWTLVGDLNAGSSGTVILQVKVN